MTYFSALLLIICLHALATIVTIATNQRLVAHKRKGFVIVFLLLIVATLAEYIAVSLEGIGNTAVYQVTLKMLELSVVPVVMMVWVHTTNGREHIRPFISIVIVNEVLQVVNVFTGIFFRIDGSGFYQDGPLYPVYAALCFLSVTLLVVETLRYSMRYQNQAFASLAAIAAFTVIGLTIHALHAQIRIDWLVGTIAFSSLYAHHKALHEQIDPMTCLLDKRNYEIHLDRLNSNAIAIIFDVDSFKQVNDSLGHAVGDECLKLIARTILGTYSKYGLCFRIGGDEFCAILTKPVPDVDELNDQFQRSLDAQRKTALPELPTVSLGYSEYAPGVDTVLHAVERADAMMYQNKNKRKRSDPLPL